MDVLLGDGGAVVHADAAELRTAPLQEASRPVRQQHAAAQVQLTQEVTCARQVLHRHVCHLGENNTLMLSKRSFLIQHLFIHCFLGYAQV